MPKRPVEGRSAVTRRAISDIIRTAVRGSYGVAGFATPTPLGHLVRALGIGEPGIRLGGDDPLTIDLHVRVAFGLPIAEVARQIDSVVRYALERDLGRRVAAVSIHVDGLEYNPGRIPEVPGVSADQAAQPVGGADVGDDAQPGERTTPSASNDPDATAAESTGAGEPATRGTEDVRIGGAA